MTPASHPVPAFRARPELPGDKSITHRAYLLALLAAGESAIEGPNLGSDCEATLSAAAALGARIRRSGTTVRIEGPPGGALRRPEGAIDLGNSGTGLRLLLGVLAAHPGPFRLTGDASLRARPVERVLEPLRRMGASAMVEGDHPPVTLRGGPLRGIVWALPVPSAQVKSALLLAGLQARGETVVTGGGGSRDHTELMLAGFGVAVAGGGDRVSLTGPTRPAATRVRVPGDPSAAMFHLVAAAICPGSETRLEGVSLNPTRDGGFRLLERMGLELGTEPGPPTAEPRGDLTARATPLQGIEVAPEEVAGAIDELPILAVAAAFARGTTVIRGAGELRVKESDRLTSVAAGLESIGVPVRLLEDGWEIRGSGGDPLPGGTVRAGGDHRIAMTFLVAGLRCREGVRIVDDPGIDTSDPTFLRNLQRLLEPDS